MTVSASRTAINVREVRRVLGFTQMEFANELGVSIAAVSNWERRVYVPSAMAVRAMRDVLATYGYDWRTLRQLGNRE